MSFQHFRLGELPLHQPLSPADQAIPPTLTSSKQPYGSGDSDDGYTLIFQNLDAFQHWRASEEDRQCVEFVKGDTHGSKADPPRFKDHTKLVCARHSRSGRKKYVKKHPERVRKVPSRKLEGQGCQASISYKTYFDTEEVRACYISQHSHDVGLANLPYTRRGRKAVVQQEKDRGRKSVVASDAEQQAMASSSTGSLSMGVHSQSSHSASSYSSAVSMLAPLPGQVYPPSQTAPQPYNYPPGFQFAPAPALPNDRWDNMATLFQTIREHAKVFEYPAASVAALETIVIRLYLESPMGVTQNVAPMSQNGIRGPPPPPHHMHTPTPNHQSNMNGSINDGGSTSNAEDTS